ncbi:methyltransferase [Variovorax sp. LjRoot290]|uniref:methyltransferase n=1 Tax=Variovorax sp. LjRoot290 TaxID=3342316 RepID=UPI003ED0DB7E
MISTDFFARHPMLSDAQVAALLDRVCLSKSDKPSRTQMWLSLPANGAWRHGGAFNAIDASEALMAMLGAKVIYPVGANDQADRYYYLQLVERVDGQHDLYLKYQTILGQRLLGGVSDAQVETLRARYEGRLPLPRIAGEPGDSQAGLPARLAKGSARRDELLGQISEALPSNHRPAEVTGPLTSTADLTRNTSESRRDGDEALTARPTLRGAAMPEAAAARSRRIDDDVLAALRAGRTEDNKFYLGPERLDPKLYKRVNAVLKDLSGQWKGGKTQAHVFEGPADEAMAAAIASGEYLTAKDFGFFPTPAGLADRAIAMAGLVPGMKVLEPSAGNGSLALRAAAIVGAQNVTACEFLERNVATLKAAGLTDVLHGDFLAIEPSPIYDAVVMNPPFGNLQDAKHVEHAAQFLKPDGVLIAIMSPSYQSRATAVATKFRDFAEASQAVVESIPAGTFRESGTEVATVILKMEARNFPWNNIVQLDEEDEQDLADAPRG